MPWETIKENLAAVLPESTLSLWIQPLEFKKASERLFELVAPDRFFCSWVQENFFADIRKGFDDLQMQDTEIKLVVAAERPLPLLPPGQTDGQLRLPRIPQIKNTVRALHPRFTFNEFMVGESNAMAKIACEAIANDDSALGRSVFIESGPGLGKSHLTHAVAHKIMADSPSTKLHYLTAQQLTAEMVRSIRSNSMEQFKEKFHNCDVLLMEDIHTLSGRIKTQEELTAALDILLGHEKRIIFTSKIPAREIPNLEPDLLSRLSGGLVTTINPPDLQTRRHIIKKKSDNYSLQLDEEQVGFLAENIRGDIRQVESAVVGLKAKMGLLGCRPDLDMLKEVIGSIVGQSEATVSAETIRDFIAKQFKTSTEELKSKSRKREVAFPRQVAMYLARKFTDQALADIGRAFNRDHSTVVHSVRVITNSINRNASVKGQVELLTNKIRKQFL
ncbi:MAG: chromosomal replication initiator protein DnaA [Desulfobulbaceae bacterium]|nr:chromosomal replication initiator protein DnaA [Desulfobulbaceae bacterium]